MAKPSEFYVGVIDLFAILLPGAIATAILAPRIGHLVLGPLVAVPTTEAGNWAAFLTCAYFLGHLMALALVPPSFARYYELRLKSTTQAYIHLIAMHRLGGLAQQAKPDDE